MVLHRMVIRAKAANVTEVNGGKVGGTVKALLVLTWRGGVWPGDICSPPPSLLDGVSEAGRFITIILYSFERKF